LVGNSLNSIVAGLSEFAGAEARENSSLEDRGERYYCPLSKVNEQFYQRNQIKQPLRARWKNFSGDGARRTIAGTFFEDHEHQKFG
jgi:hypothetical protein